MSLATAIYNRRAAYRQTADAEMQTATDTLSKNKGRLQQPRPTDKR